MAVETFVPNVVPSGLEVDFDTNITALYDAITKSAWNEAVTAAERNPTEARTWVVRHYHEEDSEGAEQAIMWRFLPLHSACARQPPAAVVEALLQAYPDGAKCIDDQGMFALHYACGNQASREVVRMLIRSFPDAAKIRDPRGMLPIHYLACWGPSSISVIDMVLVANRDIADVQDEDGNTPLDLALEGEYAEREAVVAALKRWIENSEARKSNPMVDAKPREEKKEAEASHSMEIGLTPTVGRLRQEATQLQKSKKMLENEVLRLEKELANKHETLQDALASLKIANDDRENLRNSLAEITEQHDKYRKRAEILGDRLGSLNASLYSMTEQQNIVMNAMQKREDEWSNLTKRRAEKMKELLELEKEQTGQEDDLTSYIQKQTKEMEAIQAVIAAVRQAD